MTIIVGGYIVSYPLGGMTWHHLNYLLGLHELGHEVWFLEDSGSYSYPYNPTTWTSGVDSSYGRAYLERTFAEVGLPLRYCYYSEFEDKHYGLSRDELHVLMTRADLMLCVSGVTPARDTRPRPRRLVGIDTDPVFTQLRMGHDAAFASYWRQFDAVASFGRLIGTGDCPLPTHGLKWIPTNQPIALRHWPVVPRTSRSFTTIGKWEHTADRHLEFAGTRYLSSKSVEWLRMLELPGRTKWEMVLGMQAMPGPTRAEFKRHGWRLIDPEQSSLNCQGFRIFIQSSAGEFTVAKQIYARLPSGWFSDRSSEYLASGRPVVTQDSGFGRWLPTGEGCFSFRTIDQAANALEAIGADWDRHSRAARNLAETYFDAAVVLPQLLEQVL
jgi:hypothetical protein